MRARSSCRRGAGSGGESVSADRRAESRDSQEACRVERAHRRPRIEENRSAASRRRADLQESGRVHPPLPGEFFGANYAAETITALDTGIGRSIELENGTSSWTKKTGNVVRGFVSRIDGSVQPYGLTIPASYDGKRPMRLDVWLHGTQQQMNEVRFLQQQAGPHETSQIPADDYIQLEPFARMNHSYKFYARNRRVRSDRGCAEALQHRRRAHRHPRPLDGRPSGLRHASPLQNPTFFAAFEASAGYSETKEYAGNRPPQRSLTPYQEAALHYVDAEDYALNAFNVPFVSYGGEKDAQLRASTRFREAVETRRIPADEGIALQMDDDRFARAVSHRPRHGSCVAQGEQSRVGSIPPESHRRDRRQSRRITSGSSPTRCATTTRTG